MTWESNFQDMLMGEIHRKECLSPDGDSNAANPSVICCRMLMQEELELKNSRGCVMSSKPAWAMQPCLKKGRGGGAEEKWFSGWKYFLHIMRSMCPSNKFGISANIITTTLRRLEIGVPLGFAGIHLSWNVSSWFKKEKSYLRGMGGGW